MAAPEPKIRSDKSSELERFVCEGNDAVVFNLVRNVKDLENPISSFHPEMCHQVFNEQETIFGYENLAINVNMMAGSLKTHMGIKFNRKISKALSDGLEPDDVADKMKQVLRGEGLTENINEFSGQIEKEEKEFKPLGELIHNFTTNFISNNKPKEKGLDEGLKELSTNPPPPQKNGTTNGHGGMVEKCFEIYLVDAVSTPKFVDYLKRIEAFLLFFIDAATYVEAEGDDKWKFFTLYEKYKTSEGNTAYAFVGYSSVYQFYVYPLNIRPRVAQMLILPPFQKQGLAHHLLATIYSYYRKIQTVKEITVEDPSDEFELLRDFVDAKDCKKLAAYSKEKLKSGFSPEMATEASQILKMTKRQAHRVYEILRLQETNIHDDMDFTEFRLDVKRRLNIPYQKQENDIKRMIRRKCAGAEMNKAAALDDSTRKTELESNFQQLLKHYQAVLVRLDKHGS